MRGIVSVGFMALVASACGASTHPGQIVTAGKCPSDLAGTWIGISRGDHLAIASDDTFTYAGVDGCTSHGKVSCSSSTMASGTLYVSVEVSSGGSCLSVGDYSCSFSASATTLQYNCDGQGSLEYQK